MPIITWAAVCEWVCSSQQNAEILYDCFNRLGQKMKLICSSIKYVWLLVFSFFLNMRYCFIRMVFSQKYWQWWYTILVFFTTWILELNGEMDHKLTHNRIFYQAYWDHFSYLNSELHYNVFVYWGPFGCSQRYLWTFWNPLNKQYIYRFILGWLHWIRWWVNGMFEVW